MNLIREFWRRRVFQFGVLYLGAAWVLLQVAAVIESTLELPNWVDQTALAFLALGFPVTLILAWAQESKAASAGSPDEAHGRIDTSKEVMKNSIAVLPFENLSPNPDDAYFAAGIHEEILSQLSKIKDLSVIGRTSVLRYTNRDMSLPEIAAELNVGAVMEGSVRYAGDRVRITAQLIDARTDAHLWSEVYDRTLADIFEIQADIATLIASALKVEMSVGERESIANEPTSSPEAYALYLRARSMLLDSPARSIIKYLDQATDLDPEFALAYALKAAVYAMPLASSIGVQEDPKVRAENARLARKNAEKSLALDPTLGFAHIQLAVVNVYEWKWEAVETSFERALELSPRDPYVLAAVGVSLVESGNIQRALALTRQAVDLDPKSPQTLIFLGNRLRDTGDFDAAADAFKQAFDLWPSNWYPLWLLALTETERGNNDKAIQALRTCEESLTGHLRPSLLADFARIYALAGSQEDADRLLDELERQAQQRTVSAYTWFIAYMAKGDHETALDWLHKAIDTRDTYGPFYTWQQPGPLVEPIWDHPRFHEALAKLGLKD